MKGTWQVAGYGVAATAAAAAAVAAGAAAGMVAAVWLLARLWWILGGLAAVLVVTVLVYRWLLGVQARSGIVYVDLRPRQVRSERVRATLPPAPERPAIENHVHYHWHAAAGTPARAAIPGTVVRDAEAE